MNHLPLTGIVVLEFSQYLSGPSAGLRLADLGARVIKIERPNGGDAGRKLAIKNLWAGDDSLLFHTINRNKESFTADLKDPADLLIVKKLIEKIFKINKHSSQYFFKMIMILASSSRSDILTQKY